MQTNSDLDKRKLLSAGCHASLFISALIISIGIPIAIFYVSEDIVVKENAKEAINFHFNVWLIGLVITILSFITFGLLGFIFGPTLVYLSLEFFNLGNYLLSAKSRQILPLSIYLPLAVKFDGS